MLTMGKKADDYQEKVDQETRKKRAKALQGIAEGFTDPEKRKKKRQEYSDDGSAGRRSRAMDILNELGRQ